jgi:dTMP kinase
VKRGLFITFEGTEGGGKSTQLALLAKRLRAEGHTVRELREPGGTPAGEEIRHLLKHAPQGNALTPEAELLLVGASRAQLVREVIRPALAAGEIVLCDRFFDSTAAYQGHGRGLPLESVRRVREIAVGETIPDLTLWLHVPVAVSEARRASRGQAAGAPDRFESAAREFFLRVEAGYEAIAAAEPGRVKRVDATAPIESVAERVWREVAPLLC